MSVRCAGKFFLTIVCIASAFFNVKQAIAYDCYNGSQHVYNGSATFSVKVDPVNINKSLTDAILTAMNSYAYCYGTPGPTYKDALRVNSLQVTNTTLSSLGFSAYIIDSNNVKTNAPATNVCLWPDANCSITTEPMVTLPINAKIGIQRSPDSGNWTSATSIPANAEILRMVTQMRIGGAWNAGAIVTWVFYLNAEMPVKSYTCSLNTYDKSVTLPDVSRSDLMRAGSGRYSAAKKEFRFDLNCDTQTAVSVTFEGEPLAGTEDVLKNVLTGNDNLGVQMLFSDNTPVKLGTEYPVISSAQANEILKLNAYYYYKGGTITAGPIKANTTFTFDYQ